MFVCDGMHRVLPETNPDSPQKDAAKEQVSLIVQLNEIRDFLGGGLREKGTTRTHVNARKEGSTNECAPRQAHP